MDLPKRTVRLGASKTKFYEAIRIYGKRMNTMRFPLVTAAVFAIFLGACAAGPSASQYSPDAARKEARKDFQAGRPKIYLAGGIAVYEPGIAENEKGLVAKLPRDGSLAGCTNPKGPYSTGFATAYNAEIVTLLQKNH